jgi:hypothetical protein
MSEEEVEGYVRAIEQGWRRDLKEAVKAALIRDRIPIGETRVLEIQVRRLSENPIHDYRAVLRPGG